MNPLKEDFGGYCPRPFFCVYKRIGKKKIQVGKLQARDSEEAKRTYAQNVGMLKFLAKYSAKELKI